MKHDVLTDLPKLAAPAQRALSSIGVADLKGLSKFTEANVAQLHGMGPSALGKLREALKAKSLSFKISEEDGRKGINPLKTHIILLRGVMPTGKNRVPMAQLREVLAMAGFENVRTYIQSGNALVDADLSAREVETRVHDLIRDHIGADLKVVARTGAQLQKVLEANPFKSGYDIARVFFVLFAQPPSPQKVKELLMQDFSPEELAIQKGAAYMYIPGTYGRNTLSNNYLERKLGVSATTRNLNTLRKLIEMSK